MADAVTTQTMVDGLGKLVLKFTNVSDGVGESAALKVDASTYTGMVAGSTVVIEAIDYATEGMGVNVLWDASTDVLAWTIASNVCGTFDFMKSGCTGIANNAGSGVTGDILFTTVGHTAGDKYTIILYMRKIP